MNPLQFLPMIIELLGKDFLKDIMSKPETYEWLKDLIGKLDKNNFHALLLTILALKFNDVTLGQKAIDGLIEMEKKNL